MKKFEEQPKQNFEVLPDAEEAIAALQEQHGKVFDKSNALKGLIQNAADIMEETYALGLYPSSQFLHDFMGWISHEVARLQLEDISDAKRLARLLLLCQSKELRASAINTYVFSLLIPNQEFDEAEDWLRQGIETDAPIQSINCLTNLGVMHYHQKKYDQALLELLLAYSSQSNWNISEASYYLAHLVSANACTTNKVSEKLLLRTIASRDSYGLKARDCFAGKCELANEPFSRSSLLGNLKADSDDSAHGLVMALDEKIEDFFEESLKEYDPPLPSKMATPWRGESLSWWFKEIDEKGSNVSGLLEYLSELMAGDVEIQPILVSIGLSSEPNPSNAMAVANCLFGMGQTLLVPPMAVMKIGSRNLSFDSHPLFASWVIDTDYRVSLPNDPDFRMLGNAPSNHRNYLENRVFTEPYFGRNLVEGKKGFTPVDGFSALEQALQQIYPSKLPQNPRFLLLELISREFISQLNHCYAGMRTLESVSAEDICIGALRKIERLIPEESFDGAALLEAIDGFSRTRVEFATNSELEEGNNVEVNVTHNDLFGAIAIAIAKGDYFWALSKSGFFGRYLGQKMASESKEEMHRLIPLLRLIWPLCWNKGASFIQWTNEEFFPFEINWEYSKLADSTDVETISRVLQAGQELTGPVPRILTGHDELDDLEIFDKMTDFELALVADSKKLSDRVIVACVNYAGPETLASLVANSSISEEVLKTNKIDILVGSMEVAWLVARKVVSSGKVYQEEELRLLTKAFAKTSNHRASALFASYEKLTDEYLRELALVGNGLVAEAVINNPSSTDETKALARMGV